MKDQNNVIRVGNGLLSKVIRDTFGTAMVEEEDIPGLIGCFQFG